jgi:hypothetical protein
MALSMEEQRILAEIEQELARAEPALAAYMATFGRPGRAAARRAAQASLRSPRALVVASLAALFLLSVVPVLVYTLVSLRGAPPAQQAGHTAVSARHHAPHPMMSAPRSAP